MVSRSEGFSGKTMLTMIVGAMVNPSPLCGFPMAQLKMPPLPMKMYRHFAIITVLLTACIAVFADGGNDEFAARQQQSDGIRYTPQTGKRHTDGAPRYGEAQLTDNRSNSGSFGEEASPGSFGEPTDRASGVGASSSVIPDMPASDDRATDQWLAELSEEERAQLLAQLDSAGIDDEDERARQLAVLAATSRRRIGS